MTVLVTSSDVYKEQYGYNGSPSISVFWDLDRPRTTQSILRTPDLEFIKNHKKMGNHCIYKAIGYYIPFELKVTSSDPLGDVTPITIIFVDLAT